MLRDDHSLMGGSDDASFSGVNGLLGRSLSCCLVLCTCPFGRGYFLCVLRLVSPAQCSVGI